MYLLYINALNKNHRGENIYEFIFGKTTIIEYGDNWESVPASAAETTPPPLDYIDQVGLLITESDMELDVVQESDNFSIIDAVDTIVAIGWERTPIDGIDRLVFHFGDTKDKVIEKLYSRDLELNFDNNKKYATTYEKN